MAVPSRIVSFNEARQNTRAVPTRPRSRAAAQDRFRDSQDLNNIFKLDFSEGASDEDPFAAPAAPRQALFTEDDLLEEEGAPPARKGVAGFFRKISEARKNGAKRQAERAFDRAYGGADSASESGPRAAIYTGKAGASQKRANRMQAKGGAGVGIGGFMLPSFQLPQLPRVLKRNLMAVACTLAAVMLAGSLYTPAQQYYQQIRERDRLAAEYAAVQDRNDVLQDTVDRLGTDEGLEDKAHAEFGLVMPEEQTASVIGIDVDNSPEFHANVTPGSVAAPETWYSPFLDIFFLYGRG